MKGLKKLLGAMTAAAVLGSSAIIPAAAEEYYYYYYYSSDGDEFFSDDFFSDDFFSFGGTEKFSEKVKPVLNCSLYGNEVYLFWNRIEGADGYYVYREDSTSKKYKIIHKADSENECSYTDSKISPMTEYRYKILAYKISGGKKAYSKFSKYASVETGLFAPKADIAVSSGNIRLNWKADKYADGYEVYSCYHKKADLSEYTLDYFSNDFMIYNPSHSPNDGKKIKTTADTSLTLDYNSGYDYYFRVRSYAKKDGKKVYSNFSDIYSGSPRAFVNGYSLAPKSTVPVVAYRSDTNNWTMNISGTDKKILDKFAAEHFTADMSVFDKLEYTAEYIHYNVDYAYGDDYNKIANKSYVQAVFEEHSGQCLQYNGALAEFACYLGLDVRLISGYRGSGKDNRWNHFWCEINIGGKYYVLDAGNKKDGLYNFAVPYEYASRYMYFDDELRVSPDKI